MHVQHQNPSVDVVIHPQVLLATAVIRIQNSQGYWHQMHAVLDSGSQ